MKHTVYLHYFKCLAEFQADQAILTSDLANFTTGNAISPINITKIVGAFNGTNTESSLDVEYGVCTPLIWFIFLKFNVITIIIGSNSTESTNLVLD